MSQKSPICYGFKVRPLEPPEQQHQFTQSNSLEIVNWAIFDVQEMLINKTKYGDLRHPLPSEAIWHGFFYRNVFLAIL